MRRAFSLIELLVVLSILPVVLLALAGVMRAFAVDVPKGLAVVNEQTLVLDMMDTIDRDVREAVALPDSAGDRQSDGRTLLIALPTGTVVYERTEGLVSRTIFDRDGRDDPNARIQWQAPNAVVDWQRWKQVDAANAVEVHSYIRQVVDGHPQKRLAQTRVYLLNALGRAREVQ
jgi:prepilin-type N-terminal cleavage/methylation domain-containing protein